MGYKLAKGQANICDVFRNTRRVLIPWALLSGGVSVWQIADAAGPSNAPFRLLDTPGRA